jgi:hypothetical protein
MKEKKRLLPQQVMNVCHSRIEGMNEGKLKQQRQPNF